MHGISALLYAKLPWEGPKGWQTFLDEQQEQAVARHQQIMRLLKTIDSQARHANTRIVALKGAALHTKGFYTSGERPMGDIDLLVRPDEVLSAARLLEACGYEAAFTSRRHQVFRPLHKRIPIARDVGWESILTIQLISNYTRGLRNAFRSRRWMIKPQFVLSPINASWP